MPTCLSSSPDVTEVQNNIQIPPKKPVIKDSDGEILQRVSGAHNLGSRLLLICEVEGASPYLNFWDFFICVHLKSVLCKTLVATMDDLMKGIVVASADNASTSDWFERADNPSFIGASCVMTYSV
ncbi:hypothetical protein TNCV_2259951 [Trichonephila clavipes]|nr:hypothetical protein TNCV_2259951 [Trichonephila clavipes]